MQRCMQSPWGISGSCGFAGRTTKIRHSSNLFLSSPSPRSAMHAFYADHFVLPLPEGHRFPMAKYAMLRERLQAELPSIQFNEALSASVDELALVHTARYIDAVLTGGLSDGTA